MDKAKARERMKEMRAALTSKYVNDNSERIFERLTGLPELKDAGSVLIYSHFANEVKTGGLAGWLLFYGKQVFLPVVDGDKLLVANMKSSALELNHFGIAQPNKHKAAIVPVEDMDVIVCPGLAFDRSGSRIGFGKGYYDGLLAGARAFKIGLAYDFQVIGKIDAEAHDVQMDMVVTPREVIRRQG